jgi:hypothetical protein
MVWYALWYNTVLYIGLARKRVLKIYSSSSRLCISVQHESSRGDVRLLQARTLRHHHPQYARTLSHLRRAQHISTRRINCPTEDTTTVDTSRDAVAGSGQAACGFVCGWRLWLSGLAFHHHHHARLTVRKPNNQPSRAGEHPRGNGPIVMFPSHGYLPTLLVKSPPHILPLSCVLRLHGAFLKQNAPLVEVPLPESDLPSFIVSIGGRRTELEDALSAIKPL